MLYYYYTKSTIKDTHPSFAAFASDISFVSLEHMNVQSIIQHSTAFMLEYQMDFFVTLHIEANLVYYGQVRKTFRAFHSGMLTSTCTVVD